MSLVGDLLVGGVTLVVGVVGLVYAVGAVREFLEAGRVVTGPEEPGEGDDERATYLDATIADDPDLDAVAMGQVHDTFGYWLVRWWGTGPRSNLYGLLGRGVLRVVYGADEPRDGGDRRRGWAVDPGTVPVRVDGRLLALEVGADAYPLQRLETDGETVPFLAVLGLLAFGFALLLSPLVGLVFTLHPLAGVGLVVILAGVPAGLLAGKLYHDTGLVGRWERVTGLGDDAVPDALAAAGETSDPEATGKVNLATVEPGDPLRVVGTVEPTAEGLRVVDGVVSTRGRWFLAVAATLDAVRSAVFAAVALALAAVGVAILAPSLTEAVLAAA